VSDLKKIGNDAMIYELRIYNCLPGRMPVLLNRFETVTLDMFKKYGIRSTGFWTTAGGESGQSLFYMLAWDSLAERERKWTAFAADPEWVAKRAESERDGPILASFTSQFLEPTAFSSVK
jgi:hypothetical protein